MLIILLTVTSAQKIYVQGAEDHLHKKRKLIK